MKKVREGYKMTELGEIPSEWAISKIGELTEIKTGGTPSTKCEKYWKDGDIPWMASGDVNKKIINEVDGRITKSGMENSAAKLLPKDTVMIALNGQGKTKGTVAYLNIELTCNQSLAGFLPSYNVFNSKYLYYNLQSRYFEIRGLAGDGARNGLNLGLLREILIPIPSIKEQEKIASILSTVDEQIDNVDALIEKNKELKKGLMQTLLTKGIGHTKFKKTEIGEIPDEWEVKELDLIGEIITGSTPKTSEKDNYGNEYLWVSPGDLGIKKYVTSTVKMLSDKGFSKTRKLPKGAILVTCIGSTIGKMGISKTELSTNQQINSIICNDKVNSEFIYYALNYNFNMYTSFISTQAVPIINKTTFGKFLIQVPNIKEQIKIASVLSEVDEKLDEYENRKQKLEELKRGLMQQLLTGNIRTI